MKFKLNIDFKKSLKLTMNKLNLSSIYVLIQISMMKRIENILHPFRLNTI